MAHLHSRAAHMSQHAIHVLAWEEGVVMYSDVAQWSSIRRRILREGVSIQQVVCETGISRKTVRKMLNHSVPKPYRPRDRKYPKLGPHITSIQVMLREKATLPPSASLSVKAIYDRIRTEEGFTGSYDAVKNYVRRITPDDTCIPISVGQRLDRRAHARQAAFNWMRAVLQKEITPDALCLETGDVPDFLTLLRRLYDGRLSDRNRSMVVLASHRGLSSSTVCAFLSIDRKTHGKYLRMYEVGGQAALFARQTKSTRKFDNEAVKQSIFGLLHEPPSNYGINRTTWIMPDLSRVLREKGCPACPHVIRKITKAAGYRWRKARVVLTSADPDYTEKLSHIRLILSKLGPDEAFFSIDEFGPFAVRMQPGRALSAPGEQRVVPQWQKSRGCVIVTAALELSSNQVTHFYSSKKNTAEMIRMMELLIEKYHDRQKLYLSWDAASWHISKRLRQRIEEHNVVVLSGGGPMVEIAPLPSRAQFLNVIESVFSGMARAIIHTSDYRTLDDAKAAVDGYFADRNAHFFLHPRRAGRKIWSKEREMATFSEANNCKDPRYR
jgi:transposase